MSDSNPQELKPVFIHETSYIANDEISLIDLAVILVKRKVLIAIIFIAVVALGIAGALSTPKTYTFSTSLQIGSRVIQGSIEPFDSTQTLLAKLQYNFIPNALNDHRLAHPEGEKNIKIEAIAPINSQIIILETTGTDSQATLITQVLSNISKKVTLNHKQTYSATKQNITALINQAKTELATLSNEPEKQQLFQRNIEVYQSELANLQRTHAISSPIKSLDPTGISKRKIVMISAFIGIFVAVFAAFFAEFVKKVKEKEST